MFQLWPNMFDLSQTVSSVGINTPWISLNYFKNKPRNQGYLWVIHSNSEICIDYPWIIHTHSLITHWRWNALHVIFAVVSSELFTQKNVKRDAALEETFARSQLVSFHWFSLISEGSMRFHRFPRISGVETLSAFAKEMPRKKPLLDPSWLLFHRLS